MEKNGTCASPATAFGQQCFSGSGRTHQNDALGNARAHAVYFFGFFRKSTISARSSFSSLRPARTEIFLVVAGHPRTALAEVHHLGIGTAAGAADLKEIEKKHHDGHGHQDRDQDKPASCLSCWTFSIVKSMFFSLSSFCISLTSETYTRTLFRPVRRHRLKTVLLRSASARILFDGNFRHGTAA
jgi:hypothetical protein